MALGQMRIWAAHDRQWVRHDKFVGSPVAGMWLCGEEVERGSGCLMLKWASLPRQWFRAVGENWWLTKINDRGLITWISSEIGVWAGGVSWYECLLSGIYWTSKRPKVTRIVLDIGTSLFFTIKITRYHYLYINFRWITSTNFISGWHAVLSTFHPPRSVPVSSHV